MYLYAQSGEKTNGVALIGYSHGEIQLWHVPSAKVKLRHDGSRYNHSSSPHDNATCEAPSRHQAPGTCRHGPLTPTLTATTPSTHEAPSAVTSTLQPFSLARAACSPSQTLFLFLACAISSSLRTLLLSTPHSLTSCRWVVAHRFCTDRLCHRMRTHAADPPRRQKKKNRRGWRRNQRAHEDDLSLLCQDTSRRQTTTTTILSRFRSEWRCFVARSPQTGIFSRWERVMGSLGSTATTRGWV